VWLRIARRAWTVALHASLDGRTWQLIRHCSLAPPNAAAPPGEMRIGFLAQSPTGPGCRAAFDDIRFAAGQLTDLRDGS
jgi:regulation of enolase protein 1 (concanavalin A-like superfamily)